ncbi:MAG: 6-carboxyhexanoate--CoA ligase [Thermodesulfovibrionales bacterium]
MSKRTLWSLRMRASKMVDDKPLHVSGAEGIYEEERLQRMIRDYYIRALNHSRGRPDNIVITIERIKEEPIFVSLLRVSTLRCPSPVEAKNAAIDLLLKTGVSRRAVKIAFDIVTSRVTMRGASLVKADSGKRLEPDRDRGVRVSRLGIDRITEKRLSMILRRQGINTKTVKEALTLASKVASCDGIIAELCVSDDPDYTTGYVASRKTGYVRITNLKEKGSMSGGRVFFIEKDETADIINYLEKRPVIVGYLPK